MRHPLLKKATWCFVSICIAVILHVTGILHPIENGIRHGFVIVASPFYALRAGSIQWMHERLFPPSTQQKKELEARIRELERKDAEHIMIKQENESLRAQLAFVSEKKLSMMVARAYGFSTDPNRSSILLNKGSSDGVSLNAPVIAEKGILIGKISSVQEYSSSVRLLTDHHSKVVSSILHGEKQILGILQGQFKISLKMDRVLNNEEIKKGDIVVTAGLEEGVPPGLLIGSVGDITSKQTDLFQTAYVKPAIGYNELRIVSILKVHE
ncbi:MAG: rod shape-determining protein MreC [bacterium]|nr:rod shape-determining protein MreC [bacterium]